MPLKLAFPRGERRDGTLILRVRGSFAIELQHMAPQLLERINGYLGYGAVARLKFEQGRLPRPKPPALAEPALTEGGTVDIDHNAVTIEILARK